MKNKGGVSEVVATVLILLIVVAAASILFVLILPGLRTSLDTTSTKADLFILKDAGYTVYDANMDLLSVQVKRGQDEVELSGLKFIATLDDGNSFIYTKRNSLVQKGQTRTYYLNLTTYHSNSGTSGIPVAVRVAPIIKKGEKEVEGLATSDVSVESKKILDVPSKKDIDSPQKDGEDEKVNSAQSGFPNAGTNNPITGDLVLDGEGDDVSIGVSQLPLGKSNRTVCLWMNSGSPTSSFQWAFGYGSSNFGNSFAIGHNPSGKILISGFGRDISSGLSIPVDTWVHVCGTYNGTTAKVYVNGTLANTGDKNWHTGNTRNTGGWIGKTVRGEFWNGTVDEVLIFSRVLSDSEIKNIYNLGRSSYNGSTDGLISEYDFDGTPNDFSDSFGGYNGTGYGDAKTEIETN